MLQHIYLELRNFDTYYIVLQVMCVCVCVCINIKNTEIQTGKSA